MKTVTVEELGHDWEKILEGILAGEEFVILEEGNPIAKIIPFSGEPPPEADN